MSFPPKDSPFWPILRMTLRAVVVGGCLALIYKQVDSRDIVTMIVFVLSDGAITTLAQGKSQ